MADVRILTVRQPWADCIMAGIKPVENRTRPFPATLLRCPTCHGRQGSWRGSVHWGDGDVPTGLAHTPCPWCDDTDPAGDYDGWPVRIGIHAAKTIDYSEAAQNAFIALGRHRLGHHPFIADALALRDEIKARTGAVLGTVEATGCHQPHDCWDVDGDAGDRPTLCSRWAEPGVWHWQLANPIALDQPIPAKGALGLWRPDHQLAQQLGQAAAA